MSLISYDLFKGEVDKVKVAIERFKMYEPEEGYYLAFSGGKDSVVIKALADMAKVKYDAHYNMTQIDPPEVIRFMRKYHKDVEKRIPETPFLKELTTRGFPLRQARWCCEVLKEGGGENRLVVTGVRASESPRRAKRKMVEICYNHPNKRFLHVIFDWTDGDIWEFIKKHNIPYCKLYDEGFKRIGCIFCPMSKKSEIQQIIQKYPMYYKAFQKAFVELYKNRKAQGKTSVNRWGSGEEMFEWWLGDCPSKKDDNQQEFMFD